MNRASGRDGGRSGGTGWRWLLACALVIQGCLIGLLALGDLRQHVGPFLGWMGGASAAFGVAVWALWQGRVRLGPRGVWGLVAWGLVFRATMVWSPPTLSDDLNRYVWDGRVQLAGINPYRYPPDAPELATLRASWPVRINHPDLRTVYPPLTQWMCRVGAWWMPTVLGQKLLFLGWDVAVLLLLGAWLAQRGRGPWVLVYAWHPLVVLEFAGAGHNDSLGIFWLLAGLWACEAGRPRVGVGCLALCFLAKYTSALGLPWLLRDRETRRHLWIFAALVLAAYLPFWDPGLLRSAGLSQAPGEFNSSVHAGLLSMLGSPRLVRGLCLAGLAAAAWWHLHRADGLAAYVGRLMRATIWLTPVLEPWYVCWIVPRLCFRPRLGWVVFSGVVVVSYWVVRGYVATGVWRLDRWVPWVEYGALATCLLLAQGRARWRAS